MTNFWVISSVCDTWQPAKCLGLEKTAYEIERQVRNCPQTRSTFSKNVVSFIKFQNIYSRSLVNIFVRDLCVTGGAHLAYSSGSPSLVYSIPFRLPSPFFFPSLRLFFSFSSPVPSIFSFFNPSISFGK